MYSSMENSPVKSISDQSWKCLKSLKAFNLESYCSLNVFCCLFGDIFISGGWVRKVSRFFSSAMDLWSLLLLQTLLFPATVCACTSLWTIDKGYIHICTGRVYVRKRPYKATHQCLFISNSRSLGDICLLPGSRICCDTKKPECPFQNVWMLCKKVPKQVLHIC